MKATAAGVMLWLPIFASSPVLGGSGVDPPAQPAYRIELDLPRQSYALGETLDGKVTLQNVVDVPIYISDPGDAAPSLGFEVRRRDTGDVLTIWDRRGDQEFQGHIVPLQPGGRYTLIDPVFADGYVPATDNFLPPGDYELVAHYANRQTRVAQYDSRLAVDFTAPVISVPVAFRVREPTAEQKAALARFQSAWQPGLPVADRIGATVQALQGGPLPDNFRVRLLHRQANLEFLRGNVNEAMQLLEGVREIDSFLNDAVDVQLGELLLERGRPQEAQVHLQRSRLYRARFLLENAPTGRERRHR